MSLFKLPANSTVNIKNRSCTMIAANDTTIPSEFKCSKYKQLSSHLSQTYVVTSFYFLIQR